MVQNSHEEGYNNSAIIFFQIKKAELKGKSKSGMEASDIYRKVGWILIYDYLIRELKNKPPNNTQKWGNVVQTDSYEEPEAQ